MHFSQHFLFHPFSFPLMNDERSDPSSATVSVRLQHPFDSELHIRFSFLFCLLISTNGGWWKTRASIRWMTAKLFLFVFFGKYRGPLILSNVSTRSCIATRLLFLSFLKLYTPTVPSPHLGTLSPNIFSKKGINECLMREPDNMSNHFSYYFFL